jgi:hypothetical protein
MYDYLRGLYDKGTLNNQFFVYLLRYSQKFILGGKRYTPISNIALINFLLCLECEQNTSCFKAPISLN